MDGKLRFVVAADEDRPVVSVIASHLRARGHAVSVLPIDTWGTMATRAARAVVERTADQAVVCCWTGTGAAMAANKVKGARAALCVDAATAIGARKWNDANVVALSLRLVSDALVAEILDGWLDTRYAGTEDKSLEAMGEAT